MNGSLSVDLIELWTLGPVDAELVERVAPWLSAAERASADRVRVASVGHRQAATRAMVRHVLGARLGLPPAEVEFSEVGRGKPVVAGGGPSFNVTHCDGLSVLAVATRVELGVDAEPCSAVVEKEVAERICTAAELEELSSLDGDRWRQRLLRWWVRKEAVVKVDGRGLELDVGALDVMDARAPVGWQAWGMERPSLVDLDVGDTHVAALAWVGQASVGSLVEWRSE